RRRPGRQPAAHRRHPGRGDPSGPRARGRHRPVARRDRLGVHRLGGRHRPGRRAPAGDRPPPDRIRQRPARHHAGRRPAARVRRRDGPPRLHGRARRDGTGRRLHRHGRPRGGQAPAGARRPRRRRGRQRPARDRRGPRRGRARAHRPGRPRRHRHGRHRDRPGLPAQPHQRLAGVRRARPPRRPARARPGRRRRRRRPGPAVRRRPAPRGPRVHRRRLEGEERTMTVLDPPRPPRARRRAASGMERARRREAAALVLPSLLPILVLSVAPLLIGVLLAFTEPDLVRRPEYAFVGVDNFVRLAGNSFFWESFRIGLVWAVSVTVLQLVAALGLALLLNSGLRLQGLTRVLALIPWAMPPVVVAIMWQMIYSPNAGPLNAALGAIGLPDDINWLADFSTALPAVIVVGVWVGMPQTTVTLLAGLQQIPEELHEAASMDGASAWRRFTAVTWPSLRPIVTSITSLNFIWNFNSFSLVYVLTEGGPGGRTMLPMLVTYLEAFKNRNIGYAAAMGVVLVVVVVILLAVYLWSQFREDSTERKG